LQSPPHEFKVREGEDQAWKHAYGVECNESRNRKFWAYGPPSERAVDGLMDKEGAVGADEFLKGGEEFRKAKEGKSKADV
jgi:hypothetical protein